MRNLLLFAFLCVLSGCGSVTYFGLTEKAYLLPPTPIDSPCSRPECLELNSFASQGYVRVRNGTLSWVAFVTEFYALRARLVPEGRETYAGEAIRTYQTILAQQLDQGLITEREWALLLYERIAQLHRRYAPRPPSDPPTQPIARNCVSQQTGMPPFVRYSVVCH